MTIDEVIAALDSLTETDRYGIDQNEQDAVRIALQALYTIREVRMLKSAGKFMWLEGETK